MDIISIIVLLGIVQGLFIGLLLFTRKSGNRKANRILAIMFFNFSFSMLYYYFHLTGLFIKYPHLQKTTFPTTFLYGPLLYFYIQLQTDPEYRFSGKTLLHFVPFLLVLVSNIPFYMQSSAEKLSFYMHGGIIKTPLDTVQSITQVTHITCYIIFSNFLIKHHTERVKNSLSLIDKVNLKWLKISFRYFYGIFVLIAAHLILIYAGIDLSSVYYITIPILVTAFIFAVGYNGLKQSEINILPEEKTEKKYERSSLTEQKSGEYLECLLKLMKTEKPYLENDITLLKLSNRLGISPHNLSQVLNEKLQQNFYDFINQYRVEEASRLLLDPAKENYTILAIALESGFNSKSTFNSCFKKYTGHTPSTYKKQKK